MIHPTPLVNGLPPRPLQSEILAYLEASGAHKHRFDGLGWFNLSDSEARYTFWCRCGSHWIWRKLPSEIPTISVYDGMPGGSI